MIHLQAPIFIPGIITPELHTAALILTGLGIMVMMSIQDARNRGIKRYLTLSLLGLSLTSTFTSDSTLNSFILAGLIAMALGMLALRRIIAPIDMIIGTCAYLLLSPFGIHIPLFGCVLGLLFAHLHVVVICGLENFRYPGALDGIGGRKFTRKLAFFCCKTRSPKDKYAYPATRMTKKGEVFDIWKSKKKTEKDFAESRLIIPTSPYITYMTASAILLLILFTVVIQ